MGRRANNTGSICLEKATKKYRAALSVNGKRVVKRFDTEEEAQRWLTITQADIYQGKFKDPTKVTFFEFAEKYMELYCEDLRPTTNYLYCKWLAKLSPIHKIKLQNLKSFDIQKCINEIDLSKSTKVQVRNFAKRVLKKAVDMDLLIKNPADAVIVRHTSNTQKLDMFTEEEIHKILGTAKTISKRRNYYLFILTAVLTGMRIGEILGLQYRNIGKGTITVDSAVVSIAGRSIETLPKTEAGARTIPVPRRLSDMLSANQRENMLPTDYIFHTRTHQPWSQANIELAWKQILELAQVPHRTFHKLRHYHASMLIENNVSFLDVSKRLGHANPSITVRTYSHSTPGYEDRIVEKVNDTFPVLKD